MASLDNVKILLGIDIYDLNYDDLLNLYISRAEDYTRDYCKITDIPLSLNSVIEEMAVFQYRQRGVENIQSEGKGSVNDSFFPEYTSSIVNRLKAYRRVGFI